MSALHCLSSGDPNNIQRHQPTNSRVFFSDPRSRADRHPEVKSLTKNYLRTVHRPSLTNMSAFLLNTLRSPLAISQTISNTSRVARFLRDSSQRSTGPTSATEERSPKLVRPPVVALNPPPDRFLLPLCARSCHCVGAIGA